MRYSPLLSILSHLLNIFQIHQQKSTWILEYLNAHRSNETIWIIIKKSLNNNLRYLYKLSLLFPINYSHHRSIIIRGSKEIVIYYKDISRIYTPYIRSNTIHTYVSTYEFLDSSRRPHLRGPLISFRPWKMEGEVRFEENAVPRVDSIDYIVIIIVTIIM